MIHIGSRSRQETEDPGHALSLYKFLCLRPVARDAPLPHPFRTPPGTHTLTLNPGRTHAPSAYAHTNPATFGTHRPHPQAPNPFVRDRNSYIK